MLDGEGSAGDAAVGGVVDACLIESDLLADVWTFLSAAEWIRQEVE